MARVLACLLVLVAIAAVAPLAAKGPTVRIELRSSSLPTPVYSDDARVREFEVWSGMGVSGATLADAHGFIVDWQAGPVASPSPDRRSFDVLFYIGCWEPLPGCDHPTLSYVVTYARDERTGRGVVYFPGRAETLSAINWPSIYRGPEVEGRWFHATAAWDDFAARLLSGASQ